MKQFLNTTLLLLALLLPATATPHDFEDNGIFYTIITLQNEVAVSCRGTQYNSYSNEYSGDISIPETVTYKGTTYTVISINNYSFYGCTGLKSVTIPNTVAVIGNYAFFGCSGLTNVSFPNSITVIGGSAFEGCSGLTSITIPESVFNLCDNAFSGCSGLADVHTFIADPSSISMGTNVFSLSNTAAYSKRRLHVPSGSIAAYQSDNRWSEFFGSIDHGFQDGAFWYTTTSDSTVTLSSYNNSILDGLIEIPNQITHNNLEYKVTAIGDSAFHGCGQMVSIFIPNSVTTIGDYAFEGCSSLTNITIPNSVTAIGKYAFSNCSGLTSITIPSSIIVIGSKAFNGCSSLETLNFNAISCADFSRYEHPFLNLNISTINIGNSVQKIPAYFAYQQHGLNSINIPNSVTSIGQNAFDGCSGLNSISIANSVTNIGNSTFYGCSGLTNINIPNSIKSIGDNAFDGCSSLTSITIPESVISIGNNAFKDCDGIAHVYSHIADPLSDSMGDDVFSLYYSANYSNRILHVPNGSVAAYQSNNKWRPYFGLITDNDNATIADLKFSINGIQYTITSDSTVKVSGPLYWAVSEYGPYGDEGEVDLVGNFFDFNIPDHVTYNGKDYTITEIGDWAFIYHYDYGVDEEGYIAINYNITIPETVTSIGYNAFGRDVGIVNLICQAQSPPIMKDCVDKDTFRGIINLFVSAESYQLYQDLNNQNRLFDSIYITNGEESCPPIYTEEHLEQPYSGPYGIAVKIYPTEKSTIYIRETYNNNGLYNHIVNGEWKKYDERDSIYFYYEAENDFGAFPDGWAIEFFAIEEGKNPSPDTKCGLLDKMSMGYKWGQSFDFRDCEISYNLLDNCAGVTFSGYQYSGPGTKSEIEEKATSLPCNINKEITGINTNYDTVVGYDIVFYSGEVVIPSSATYHDYYNDMYTTHNVTFIDVFAFWECVDLISVTLPQTIVLVREDAFANCPNLSFIKCYGTTPACACDESFDQEIYQNTTLYVPMSAIEAYRNAEGWKNFQNIVGFYNYDFVVDGISYSVTGDQEVIVVHGEEAYQGNMVIPATVTYEGNTYTVTGIGSGAFANAAINCLTLPVDVINNIANNAFEGSNIHSVYITGNGAWSAGDLTSGVENLYVGSGVTATPGLQVNPTTIYSYAEVPPACDENTFIGYDAVLHVPASSLASYFTAPYWSNFINIVGDAVEPTGLTLDNDSITILVGNQEQLTATLEPQDATPNQVLWTSSNEGVATVVDGLIQAIGAGECDIKASLLDKSAVCHVTVTEIAPTKVTLNQTFAKLETGSQFTLTATVLPDDATDKVITWATSNQDVAAVDSQGNVTAVGPGECVITASCRDKQATCHVIVVEHFIFITLDRHELSVLPNHIEVLMPNISPVSTDLVVTSSNPAVAAARLANGRIQVVGVSEGSATITINSADGYAEADSCIVTVYTERGDVNSDGFVNITDATMLISYLSLGDPKIRN